MSTYVDPLYVVFECDHPSLAHSTHLCHLHNEDHSSNSSEGSHIHSLITVRLNYYEILNSRFALEHRYSMNVNEKSCCIYKAEKKKSFLNSIFGKSKESTWCSSVNVRVHVTIEFAFEH